jgi:hypothetical protein
MPPHDQPVDDARELRDRLLGPLHMHFLAARQAYEDYRQNGRSFLFACSLRRINAAARQLLLTSGHLLPEEHAPDAIALVRHYDVWLTLWDDHSARLKPAMTDPFVFENSVTFPKPAQERLLDLYQRLG